MSPDLDLAAIEARAKRAEPWTGSATCEQVVSEDIPALVARVRELEAALERNGRYHQACMHGQTLYPCKYGPCAEVRAALGKEPRR